MSSNVLKTIREDDFVEYFLFPELSDGQNVSYENNERELINTQSKINSIIESYCSKYIWHKDDFRVTPRLQNANLLLDTENGDGESGKFDTNVTLIFVCL